MVQQIFVNPFIGVHTFLSNPSESIRRARLRAQAKIDAELKLRRSAHKDKWGIALDYSYRWG